MLPRGRPCLRRGFGRQAKESSPREHPEQSPPSDEEQEGDMAVTVRIPTPLQRLTNGQGEVPCDGKTVTELLADLEKRYPGIKERLCDEKGQLRRFVNVFVNEEDIRFLKGDQTAVKDGDEVSIIPAIAGG